MSNPKTPQQQHPPSITRSRNQLNIFLTGATLLTLSSLLTRRSLNLRRQSITPRFYHPSNAAPLLEINGRLEAYQALGIATINVASFFVMMGGGLLWAYDVGGLEDFRRRVGGRRGVDGKWKGRGERVEDEEEDEFGEWVASLTGRKMEEKKKDEEERRWSAREAKADEAGREG